MRKIRLIDLYPDPLFEGVFYEMSQISELANIFQSIGIESEDDYHSIDVDYILNNSGLKPLSMVAEHYFSQFITTHEGKFVLDDEGNRMTYVEAAKFMSQTVIKNIILIRFRKKWTDLIDTVYAEYNILTPYEMTVSEDTNETEKEETTSTRSGSDNVDVTNDNDTTNTRKVAGYNSATFNDSEQDIVDDTFTSKTERSNEQSASGGRDRTNMATRNISRKGNIGNRSAAELLEQQRELVRYQVLQEIYNDLDSILTRSMY